MGISHWGKLLIGVQYLAFIDWMCYNREWSPSKMEFISVNDSDRFTIIPYHKAMSKESKCQLGSVSDFDAEYVYCVPVNELHASFLPNLLYGVLLNHAENKLNVTIATVKISDFHYLKLHMPANIVYWGSHDNTKGGASRTTECKDWNMSMHSLVVRT